ncbi:RadC family protein [Chitinophaga lutea]
MEKSQAGLLAPIYTFLRLRALPPIRDWAPDDRPREKLLKKGPRALSLAELLAILIQSGTPQQSALELAQAILRECDGLSGLARMDYHSLLRFPGIGEARAAIILAALELARRRETAPLDQAGTYLHSGSEAAALLRPLLQDEPCESLHALFLNHANRLLGHSRISSGGLTYTSADPRVIFEAALRHKATRLLLCHNHPSGNLKPSQADLTMTQRLREAGKLLEIDVIDHVIVADAGYLSLREDGWL